jgi:hypothetical protein
MTTRKPCTNVATASFTGKEQSPLHFGLSAEGYELNTAMEGFDHMIWEVKIKNNKKVWVRQTVSTKMVHEEPVIYTNISDTESKESSDEQVKEDIVHIQEKSNVPIMKASVEEKKTNNYNLFLTYRLQELKKGKKGSNKELFTAVVAEWKELKKKPDELNKILTLAQEYQAKRSA